MPILTCGLQFFWPKCWNKIHQTQQLSQQCPLPCEKLISLAQCFLKSSFHTGSLSICNWHALEFVNQFSAKFHGKQSKHSKQYFWDSCFWVGSQLNREENYQTPKNGRICNGCTKRKQDFNFIFQAKRKPVLPPDSEWTNVSFTNEICM